MIKDSEDICLTPAAHQYGTYLNHFVIEVRAAYDPES
jgi:hypothetical protein